MSDLLTNNWWETSAFEVSHPTNDGWEDLDGDLELFLAIEGILTGDRKSFWEHERLDWDRHVEKLLHEERFHIRHRMPLEDFHALVEVLGDTIETNVAMSKRRCNEPIHPEMAAAVGIRVLAGGNCDDTVNALSVSKSGFCRARNKLLTAPLDCDALSMNLPTAPEEWEKKRKGFADKSSNRVIDGCTGASDVFFQPSACPTVVESDGFPRARHLGHHQSHGLNCQAACDARLRFMMFTVIAPGQMNDAGAREAAGLRETIDNLPGGLCVAGDAACVLTEHPLVPFTGSNRQDPDRDSCNFCLSQLQQRNGGV